MANRLGGTNEWQDGDVLTAADLNDTLDALENGIETLGDESVENRDLINTLYYLTNNSENIDANNLKTDFHSDADGFNDTVNTGSSYIFESGTVNGFISPQTVINDDGITYNKITGLVTGDEFNATYHPIQDLVFEVTSIQSVGTNNDDTQIDYNLLDLNGNTVSSGSFTFDMTEDTSNFDVPSVVPVASQVIAVSVTDTGQGRVVFFDIANETQIGSSHQPQGSINSTSPFRLTPGIVTTGSTEAQIYLSYDDFGSGVVRYDVNKDGYTIVQEDDNITGINIQKPNFMIIDKDSNTTTVCYFNVFDQDIKVARYRAPKDFKESNASGSDSDNQDSGITTDGRFVVRNFDNGLTAQGEIDLFTGDVDTSSGTTANLVQSGIDDNDSAVSSVENSELITMSYGEPNHIEYSVYNIDQERAKGTSPTSFNTAPISLDSEEGERFIIDDDNSKGHVSRYDPQNGEIEIWSIDATEDEIEKNNFTYFFDVDHDDDVEYIKVYLTAVGGSLTQYELIDRNSNTNLGTFNEGQRVYIGDKNAQNLRVRIEGSNFPLNVGINAYGVLVW